MVSEDIDDIIRKQLPARSVPIYIKEIVHELINISPGTDTNITNALHTIADTIKRRGLIIIISDLLDDSEKILQGMKHLRYNDHEILVFHIIDDQEFDFDFNGEFIFEDLENSQRIKTDSRFVRTEYVKRFKEHCKFYKSSFHENKIDYIMLKTSEPVEKALGEYLLKRKKLF